MTDDSFTRLIGDSFICLHLRKLSAYQPILPFKVPIIMHEESKQATEWSQVYSEETEKQSIQVVPSWQLNKIMYGELHGLNKQETADKFGKEKVHEWRRSYDIPPPNGESLEMCAERVVSYFKEKAEIGRQVIGDREWEVYRVLLDDDYELFFSRSKIVDRVMKMLMG